MKTALFFILLSACITDYAYGQSPPKATKAELKNSSAAKSETKMASNPSQLKLKESTKPSSGKSGSKQLEAEQRLHPHHKRDVDKKKAKND